MALVYLLIVLALLQFAAFGMLVGRARGTYGVKAPATTGHEIFERYYRVQMNTLEMLVLLLPATWIAARYFSPALVSAPIALYLIGRIVYLRAYIANPASRSIGFALSFIPVLALLIAGLFGAGRALVVNGM